MPRILSSRLAVGAVRLIRPAADRYAEKFELHAARVILVVMTAAAILLHHMLLCSNRQGGGRTAGNPDPRCTIPYQFPAPKPQTAPPGMPTEPPASGIPYPFGPEIRRRLTARSGSRCGLRLQQLPTGNSSAAAHFTGAPRHGYLAVESTMWFFANEPVDGPIRDPAARL